MINLYPPSVHDMHNKERLQYSVFIDAACEEIKKACEGIVADERAIIKVLGSRSPNDRTLIAYRFKDLFGIELKSLLRSETIGDFGFLLKLLSLPPPEADAFILHYATSGVGTKESLIYPVIMARTATELTILKRTFYDVYQQDLSVVMDSELSGDFKQIITTALQTPMLEFKSSYHTKAKAEEDAHKLYKAGEGKWFGTDEESFLKILLSSPPQHIEHINAIYCTKRKHDLKQCIQKEFKGDAEKALTFFVRFALEPKEFIDEYLESTINAIPKDEKVTSAAIIRYHPLLPVFSSISEQMKSMSLKERIKGEVDGDYRNLLITVMDAPSAVVNP